MSKKFKHAVVGGTFDRLHSGHKKLLQSAFTQAEKVTIGLTLPPLYKNKLFSETIQPFTRREKSLLLYLKENGWTDKTRIVAISDLYGSTLKDTTLDAIIVSEETGKNALQINAKRQECGMAPLTIITIPLLLGEDTTPLSSENIRKGIIDTQGNSYSLLLQQKSHYTLPTAARSQLQQPIGDILQEDTLKTYFKNPHFITTVGDITTLTLLSKHFTPAVAIIDGKTRRKTLEKNSFDSYFSFPPVSFLNPAGTINSQAAKIYQDAVDKHLRQKTTQVILIEGEEDLLALPAILLAPLGSYVLYGQYQIGIVAVKITEEKKKSAQDLLRSFT